MSYNSVFKDDLFSEDNIIVTGGGSGIGRCTAHELAALGANVIIVGRNQDKLEKVKVEIESSGGNAIRFACDIRDEDAVIQSVTEIYKQCDKIHGLVNNAGGQFPSPAEHISQKGFETVVRTNLVGGFLFCREIYNQGMMDSGGAIVNITADMWNGMPSMSHSGAARAGMDNLTKTLAYEWGHAGVRVNSVAPGYIASSGLDTYEGIVKKIIPRLKESVPLKRMGTESEVSTAICFLLSEAAAYINGSCIRVDGGSPLGNSLWPLKESDKYEPYDGFHLSKLPDVLDGRL